MPMDKEKACEVANALVDTLEALAPFAPPSWGWYAVATKVLRAVESRVCDDQRFADVELTPEEAEFVAAAVSHLEGR